MKILKNILLAFTASKKMEVCERTNHIQVRRVCQKINHNTLSKNTCTNFIFLRPRQ